MNTIEELADLALANRDAVNWYRDAQAEIESVVKLENWRVSYFAGILAVTSPRCNVRRNIRVSLQYCGTGRILKNVMKSIRRSIEIFETNGDIRGPKTSAFYAALTGDRQAVVLDTHMAGLFDVEQSKAFRRKPELRYWTTVVREVGYRVGMDARDAQACLWFGRKRAIGDLPTAFPLLEEYRGWIEYGREFPADGIILWEDSDDTF